MDAGANVSLTADEATAIHEIMGGPSKRRMSLMAIGKC